MPTQSTTSMVSEVSICNQALSWLGQNAILSLDDESVAAEWMNNNYPFIRDAVTEERMWTFATARYKSVTATATEWGHYVHDVPLGWLSVYRVFLDQRGLNQFTDYRVESNGILASVDTLWLWGLERVVDTGKFSTMFTQALAARIAADAAIPLTQNRQLQIDMWALYGDKLAAAAARDGQQGTNDKITQTTLVNSRFSSGAMR
jgi:hypothetical protein